MAVMSWFTTPLSCQTAKYCLQKLCNEYLNETLAKSEDMLTADKIENGGKGILMKVDTGLTHEESANYRDNGVASDAIENMIAQADTWDEKVHNYQATSLPTHRSGLEENF